MRIGVDARTWTAPQPRGIGTTLREAYRRLRMLKPDWEFVLYHQRPITEDRRRDPDEPWHEPNVRLRQIDMPGDRLDAWFQMRLPLAARQDRVDVMHFPANAAPAWCPTPFVLTVHDLIPLTLPGECSESETRAFQRGLLRGVRRAVHIIAISAATRDDLHRLLEVPRELITVIPWAPHGSVLAQAERSLAVNERQRLRDKYDLSERWLITLSGRTPRKNARGVLDAFARVAPALRRQLQMVLTGCEPESYRAQLYGNAERHGLSQQCRILGYVPEADLPGLLGGARGLVMPSRYEGFGLPILDAFALGVPVLAARGSSMPEVAGDAAVYCDAHDPRSIARAMEKLLDDDTARELVARGRARLRDYSWTRTAEAMCAVFEKARGNARVPAVAAAGAEGIS